MSGVVLGVINLVLSALFAAVSATYVATGGSSFAAACWAFGAGVLFCTGLNRVLDEL